MKQVITIEIESEYKNTFGTDLMRGMLESTVAVLDVQRKVGTQRLLILKQ